MAQQRFVDDAGQVWEQSDGGLKLIGTRDTVPPTQEGMGSKVARVTEATLKRGVLGLPKFFADAIYDAGNVLESRFPTPSSTHLPGMRPSEAIDTLFGGKPEAPKNAIERLIVEGGGGAIEGAMTGPAVAGKMIEPMLMKAGAIGGAGAGLGGETAASLYGDNPLTRVIGAILGGGLAYPAMRAATGGGAARRVNEVTQPPKPGMNPDDVLAPAQSRMREAAKEGVSISLPQAVEQPTPLATLAEDASRSSRGPTNTAYMTAQTPAALHAGQRLVGMFKLGKDALPPVHAVRRGEIGPEGAYFSTQGRSTYYDPGTKGVKSFDIGGAKIADTSDHKTAISLIQETLKDRSLTAEQRTRLNEALVEAKRGEPFVDYMLADETPMAEAGKRLGFDGFKVWENDDVGGPTSVFIWNTNKVRPYAEAQRITPSEVAEDVQKAASGALKRADTLPGKVAKAEYEFTKQRADPQEWMRTYTDVQKSIKEVGPTTDAGVFLKEQVLDKIATKTKGEDGRTLPKAIQDLEQLKTILHEAAANIKQPSARGVTLEDRSAGMVRKALEDTLGKLVASNMKNKTQGDLLYKQIHDAIVEPMERGPLGKLAGKHGFDPSEGPKIDQIFNVLSDKNMRASTIQKLQVDMDKDAPGTFARYARTAMERKLEEAFKAGPEGTPLNAPGKFAESMWGGAHQQAPKENFKAVMFAAARSQGKSTQEAHEFVRGAEKLVGIIESAGRGKVIRTTDLKDPLVGEGVKGIGSAVLYPPQATGVAARLSELFTMDKTRRQIFEWIWSPEGVDQIRKYARMSIPDIRTAFIGTAAVQPAQQGEN